MGPMGPKGPMGAPWGPWGPMGAPWGPLGPPIQSLQICWVDLSTGLSLYWWDLASLAKPWDLENLNWASLKKHGLAYFQNILKIGVCFQTILKKYPLLRARRRPEGAAEGGTGGIFWK